MTGGARLCLVRLAAAGALAALLSGCAAERLHREGLELLAQGRSEEGLAQIEAAAKEAPENFHYRAELITRRAEVVNRLLAAAASERASGRPDEAQALYQRVLKLNPGNERAQEGLNAIARDKRHAEILERAKAVLGKGDPEQGLAYLEAVLRENPAHPEALAAKRVIEQQHAREAIAAPMLKLPPTKPINLEFRDANLRMVFEALSRTTSINFILDKDVRPDLKTTVFLRQSSLEDAVDLLLVTNQLEKKIINPNTILIYPNTPQKLKDYQDLVVKSFYLANTDVKQVLNTVKTLLKTKDVVADEKLNLLIMRDTPDAVRLAEKLIAMHDLTEPEVMLEVEVLEVKRTKLVELGIKFPDQLTLAPLPSSGATLTLNDLRNLNSSRVSASLSSTIINLHKDDSNANLLANPRIRAKNREKAKILIGDRVPVITTTSTATGFVSESVSYVDVGIKLEVEPTVYLQDDVAIKVGLEVSSIVREVRTTTGSLTYQIGTRNASTVLQLKDGETQVLAGLISDEDRATASKVPGLGDMPVLGRLFSSHRDDNQKTEIVLSITPRIIRNLKRLEPSAEEFWSGTEAVLRAKPLPLRGAQVAAAEGTAVTAGAGAAPTPESAPQPAGAAVAAVSPEPAFPAERKISIAWQGSAQARVGEQFKLALRIKSDTALRSLPFQVGYDPAALQVVEVAEGGYFRQEGAKTNFTSNVDAAGGRIFVGASATGAAGVKGEENVAVITFKAAAPKQAEVKLLAATPVGAGDRIPPPTLPNPHVVAVTQ